MRYSDITPCLILILLVAGCLQYALTSYHCNRELRGLFIPTDYAANIRTAISPDIEVLSICPSIQLTCCSMRELRHIAKAFRAASDRFKAYQQEVIDSLEIIDELQEAVQKGEVKIGSDPDANGDDRETDHCKLTGGSAEALLSKLHGLKPEGVKLLEAYTRKMLVFFSGFACTLCDGVETQSIHYNEGYELALDQRICIPQMELQLMLLKVARLAHDLTTLAVYLVCTKDKKARIESREDDRLDLLHRTNQLTNCISWFALDTENVGELCRQLCKASINVLFWEDEHKLRRNATLSQKLIRWYLDSERQQQPLDEKERSVSVHFKGMETSETVRLYTVRTHEEIERNFRVRIVEENGLDFYLNPLEAKVGLVALRRAVPVGVLACLLLYR